MPLTTCPGCADEIRVPGRPRVGSYVTCRTCGSHLEVVDDNPLELDFREGEDDEDLDDYDDEDDDN